MAQRMSLILVVATNGRRGTIERSIPSLAEHVHGPFTQLVILDDSGDLDYAYWLEAHFGLRSEYGFEVHSGGPRGYDGAYRWRMDFIAQSGAQWCFLHEDDFLYEQDVPLVSWMEMMSTRPNLLQISLKRQAWFPHEVAAGGIVEAKPEAFQDVDMDGWPMTAHRDYWTFNPTLFRAVTAQEVRFPLGAASEWNFHKALMRRQRSGYYALWGATTDAPRVQHIGDERIGTMY
jgi:hypothetical protein